MLGMDLGYWREGIDGQPGRRARSAIRPEVLLATRDYEKLLPQPQERVTFGLLMANPAPVSASL